MPDLTHYEILGFEKYGNGVGEEALKKAYRKAVLKYHPDKTGVQDGEEDEVRRHKYCRHFRLDRLPPRQGLVDSVMRETALIPRQHTVAQLLLLVFNESLAHLRVEFFPLRSV